MKYTFFLVVSFLLFSQMPIIAEEQDVFGIILYAEGYEVTLFHNDGSVQLYDVLNDDLIGEPLYEGESIETDAESYVEIQLYPSENILKLSESSALTLNSMGSTSNESELSLLFGSIRAKVSTLVGDETFSVRTGDAVAGVRGTDFGVDYLYDETDETYSTEVFCFEGEIEVRDQEEADSSGPERYRIGPNEQVSVRPRPGGPVAFERKQLVDDRRQFWQKRDFREAPIKPDRIDNRFPNLRNRVQTDAGRRRLTPEQRRQPGFQGVVPQRPMQPGNRQAPLQQQSPLQNNNPPNIQQPALPQRDKKIDDALNRRF